MDEERECPSCGSKEEQQLVESFEHLGHVEKTYFCKNCGEEYCILGVLEPEKVD